MANPRDPRRMYASNGKDGLPIQTQPAPTDGGYNPDAREGTPDNYKGALKPSFTPWDNMFGQDRANSAGTMPMPQYPGYKTLLDQNGVLPEQLQSRPEFEYGMMERLKQDGMNNSSPWTNMMLKRQGVEQHQALQEADQRGASSLASATSQLQARGGMDSGARMRLASQGAHDQMMAAQDVRRQGEISRYDIMGKGEDRRNAALQAALGVSDNRSNAMAQAGQFNIGNSLREKQMGEAAKLMEYQEKMKLMGAARTADATENADSGGSSFICTALRAHGLMDKRETITMTRFMLGALFKRAEFFAWYFRHGKKAIELAERQNFDWSTIKSRFVDEIMSWIPRDEEIAQVLYMERSGTFVRQFIPGLIFPHRCLRAPSLLRSLWFFPQVLSLPSTWKWAYGYFTPRIKKFGLKKARALVA